MSDRKPAAPADLGGRGRRFWRATVGDYELTASEMELLAECCRLMDETEALRLVVDDQGTTVTGSAGQTRVHPALGELRQHRLAMGKLLAQLALPNEDGTTVASPLQARARRAAESRWAPARAAGLVSRGAS